MRVFSKEDISYSDLLVGIKLLIEENKNNECFVSKKNVDIALDYMLELKNKDEQKFLIDGITRIDERMTEAFEKNRLLDSFHKLPVIVSLIRIVKEGGYDAIKDLNPDQASTLAAVTWSATEKLYPCIVAVYTWKEILNRLLEKSQNINDNLLLAIEMEKRAKINYKGDLKMQIIKMCEFLDSLDEKALQDILNKETCRKK